MDNEQAKTPEEPAKAVKKPKKRKRALWWRITRVVLIIVAIPIVLLAIAVGYVHTDAGKERVRGLVQERIAKKVNGTVEIEALDYELFGDSTLKGLRIRDEAGREAIVVDKLYVRPAWGEITDGSAIALDELELTGLHVLVVKDADGSSNLKTLFKKSEQQEESKPNPRPIALRKIAISDVDVVIQSPDGTELALRDVAITGRARGVIASKDLSVDLDPITLELDLKKPANQGGLTLAVKKLKTGLAVDLVGGKGNSHLKPLSAELALLVPGKIDHSFPIGFDGISFDVGQGAEEGERDLGLSLEKLALGAVSLASIEVKGTVADGALDGPAAVNLLGLHVDAPQVNALLGKDVLKSSVDLEAHLKGTATLPELAATITTQGGVVKIAAKLDLVNKADPSHDVRVEARDIDTDMLLAPALGIAPVKVASLDFQTRGHGGDGDTIATSAELSAKGVLVRGVLVDSIDAKAQITGPHIAIENLAVNALEQKIVAKGTYDRGSKAVDLELGLSGDIGVAIAKAKEAGLPVTTNLPAGYVKLHEGDLRIKVKGGLESALEVAAHADKLEILGGKGKLDASVALEHVDLPFGLAHKKLKSFDLSFDLDGLYLSSLLAKRGKQIPPALGIDAAIALRLRGKGTIDDPLIDLTANITELRKDKGPRAAAVLTAHVTKTDARIDLLASDVGKKDDVILALRAAVPLLLSGDKKGLDPSRAIDVSLELPRRELADVAKYVPTLLVNGFLEGKPIPSAHLLANVHLHGSVARPTAEAHIEIEGALLDPTAGAPRQALKIDAKLDPPTHIKPSTTLVIDLGGKLAEHLKPVLAGKITAVFPYSPLMAGAVRGVKYDAHLALGIDSLASLPAIKKIEARALGGAVNGTIDVQGNIQDVTAQVKLDAIGLLTSLAATSDSSKAAPAATAAATTAGPLDVHVAIDVSADKTAVSVQAELEKQILATVGGTLGLAGKGLIPRAKLPGGLDPSLDLELEIPERALSSLQILRPKLKEYPGRLAGSIKASGTAKRPLAKGGVVISDVAVFDGPPTGAAVELELDGVGLHASVGIGALKAVDAPVLVDVRAARESLFNFLKKPKVDSANSRPAVDKTPEPSRVLALDVKANARHADIRRLIPVALMKSTKLEPKGALDWAMTARIELDKEELDNEEEKPFVKSSSLDGTLALQGNVPLPGSKRMYQNIDLAVSAAGSKVKIEKLHLEESDAEVKDRWVTLDGEVALEKLKPSLASARLQSNKWLVFGAKPIGLTDAPRGDLTIDAKVHAELDRPIRLITVEVDKLQLLIPDRFEKAHQPEDVHLGDVVFLEKNSKGEYLVAPGKLPLPASVAAEKERLAALERGDPPKPPGADLDIDIHIAPGARLFQSPIDVTTEGSLSIAVRPDGRKIRGKLTMTKGELSLGGKMHALTQGSLVFSDEYPQGFVDFWFEKKLPPWTLRNVSEASAGDALKIHSYGPISDRKSVLSGAGSPGALSDLLSMHNVGRERFVTGADLPESVTVDFPQYGGVLALSFISVNLPHLLFLDRVEAWSDPFDDSRAYGRLEHYEGERYFAEGKGRVRAGKRPAALGRSEAELEVDYLFLNDNRVLFGVGATGGTRGGGGPAVVMEWSSKE